MVFRRNAVHVARAQMLGNYEFLTDSCFVHLSSIDPLRRSTEPRVTILSAIAFSIFWKRSIKFQHYCFSKMPYLR